jgi:homoserine/homoserine lactone efflux protein
VALSIWLTFFAASWLISLSPGTAAVYAMTCGLNEGFKRSLPGLVGLVLGVWTSLSLVGVGLGAVLASSPYAFTVLKWLGVAYLAYLGIKQWRAPGVPLSERSESAPARSAWQIFIKGWAVNATNPKGYVFLLAVLPQFIDSSKPLLVQYLVIALTFALTEFVVMMGYAALASRLLHYFRTTAQMKMLNRVFGGLFVAAAAALGTFRRAA